MIAASFDPGFTTSAMAAAFSPAARVRAMCRVEAALASASADAGVIDREVAREIVAACQGELDHPDAILAGGWEVGTPVLALLEVLRTRLSDVAAAALHHGATTQDIVDTGLMLQAREGLGTLRDGLAHVCSRLRELAATHRDTPATAWTFLQPAVPTTVGLRVAGWLSPTVRHAAAVRQAQSGLPLQLGGPTGSLEALGPQALAVQDGVGAALGLRVPELPWHTDRSHLADLAGHLERVAGTMAKIGTDLALLAHRDVARMRGGESSSMPDKHNPIDAVRAVATADACRAAASVVTGGRPHELERGVGGWHAEWWAMPMAFQTCAASVEAIGRAVDTLTLPPEDVDRGPTVAAATFVDRVVAACDRELSS